MNRDEIDHVGEFRLAEIASGAVPDSAEETHLAECRRCAALHAELIRVRLDDLSTQESPPNHVLVAGTEFVRSEIRGVRVNPGAHPRPGARRRLVAWLSLGLAVAALLVFLVGRSPVAPSLELPEPVRTALIERSAQDLVYACVADELRADRTPVRGGAVPKQSTVIGELREAAYDDPGSAVKALRLVYALQAAQRRDAAREELDTALELHPDHPGLRELEVHQHYDEGNLGEAERLVRERLQTDPEDSVAELNLVIILNRRGYGGGKPRCLEESRARASRLVDRLGASPLGQRARQVLAQSGEHG